MLINNAQGDMLCFTEFGRELAIKVFYKLATEKKNAKSGESNLSYIN